MQSKMRNLVYRPSARSARVVANAERDCPEPHRSTWMPHGHEDGAEAAGRPRDVGLDTPPELRAVASFGLAGHQPRLRDATLPAKVLAEGMQGDLGARRQVFEIHSERVVVKADREDRLGLTASHAQPSSSVGSDPK
jgi:hypothetical protein